MRFPQRRLVVAFELPLLLYQPNCEASRITTKPPAAVSRVSSHVSLSFFFLLLWSVFPPFFTGYGGLLCCAVLPYICLRLQTTKPDLVPLLG